MARHDGFHHVLVLFNQESTTLANTTLCLMLLPSLLGYYVMAILVQLPGTRFHRAALLPVVLWLAIRPLMMLDFSGNGMENAINNYALTVAMSTLAMRATAWTLADKPYVRLSVPSNDKAAPESTPFLINLRSALWNACDLCCNFRGLGWNWSQGLRLPSSMFKTTSRLVFVGLSLGRLFLSLSMVAGLGLLFCSLAQPNPGGWSISDTSLPPIQRYVQSTTASWLAGFIVCFWIEANYQFQAILFTSLFQQRPQQWPPIFDQPWFSTSLSHFWGRGWHQFHRESYMAVGVKPLKPILGTYSVLGAFVISGVYHDVALRGMGRGGNSVSATGFFVTQGVGVVLERLWTRLTGRKVGGVLGWLWVWVWLTVWGRFVVDEWTRKFFIVETVDGMYIPSSFLRHALKWIQMS